MHYCVSSMCFVCWSMLGHQYNASTARIQHGCYSRKDACLVGKHVPCMFTMGWAFHDYFTRFPVLPVLFCIYIFATDVFAVVSIP